MLILRTVQPHELLRDVLSIECEYLNTPIATIGDIHEVIPRQIDIMNRLEVLKALGNAGGNLRRRRGWRADRNRWRIDRFPAVRPPHAFEAACLTVVDHHATVAVSIGDEQLVRLRMDPQPRCPEEKRRRIASRLPALSDLHHKLSGSGELQDLTVLRH